MSENLRKVIGVAVMAAIVVVGFVVTNDDDSDFDRTRNVAFAKEGVMAKESSPVKGGDCCDEALYRISQLEERIERLEGSPDDITEVRARTPVEEANRIIDQRCDSPPFESWEFMRQYADCVANLILSRSLDLESARFIVETRGMGFYDLNTQVNGLIPAVFCGTLTAAGSDSFVAVAVGTTPNGIVDMTSWSPCPRPNEIGASD